MKLVYPHTFKIPNERYINVEALRKLEDETQVNMTSKILGACKFKGTLIIYYPTSSISSQQRAKIMIWKFLGTKKNTWQLLEESHTE